MKTEPRRTRTNPATPRLVVIEHPGRSRLSAAIERCSPPQRTMLALMLLERMTPAEAATSLGIPVEEFERAYRSLMVDLRRTMDKTGSRWRSAKRLAREYVTPLRKAS